MRILGLMSGTSLDGVDGVVVDVDGDDPATVQWSVRAAGMVPFTPAQRDRIRAAIEAGSPVTLNRLHAELGEWFAAAALQLLEQGGIRVADLDLVVSHGQTVWHEPPVQDRRGATLQLGDAATLAERLGVDVVSDLRTRDVAAGGQGAPLVPWGDVVCFSRRDESLALQNLGGMANVTVLPRRSDSLPMEDVLAFDTGPGVALLDGAAARASGGRSSFDEGGSMARRGTLRPALLDELMNHPFFRIPPPRSTGREEFGDAFLGALLEGNPPAGASDWDDLMATLTAFTARSMADAYRAWVLPRGVDRTVLLGGGALNPALVDAIRLELGDHPVSVGSVEALGVEPEFREALCFALLGWAHRMGIPGNVPSATGASGPRVLGSLTPGGVR